MKEPIEERLASIESRITASAQMQEVVFSLLLLVYRRSSLFDLINRKLDSGERLLGWGRRELDSSLALVGGTLGAFGVSVGLLSVYAVTQDPFLRLVGIGTLVFGGGLIVAGLWRLRHGRRYLLDAERMSAETASHLASRKKEAAALDETLTKILTIREGLNPTLDDAGIRLGDETSDATNPHCSE